MGSFFGGGGQSSAEQAEQQQLAAQERLKKQQERALQIQEVSAIRRRQGLGSGQNLFASLNQGLGSGGANGTAAGRKTIALGAPSSRLTLG